MLLIRPFPDLIAGQMSIWFIEVDRPEAEIKELRALLSSDEKDRAQRFRFLPDCNRYVVQHGVLRKLLANYIGCEPDQVKICVEAHGKPYLAEQEEKGGIHFSISCSDSLAAFAFSRIGSIGIDIEKIRDIPDMPEIVRRHFTTDEKHEFFSRPESLRSTLFYQYWSRKEAVLKAQGEGLLKPLDCVDVSASRDFHRAREVKVACNTSEVFWVADVDGPAGFAVAAAANGPIESISVVNYIISGN